MAGELSRVGDPARLALRRARFEDGGALLRLVERAIERGCRSHYDEVQRRAVFVSYARRLFVELCEGYDTLVAEGAGRLVGMAQLDAEEGRLRALFVDGTDQGLGVGRALLRVVEDLARARGRVTIEGAMSLNAVRFYERSGFGARGGPARLWLDGTAVPVLRMSKRLR
jgi:GNAT superfamily N-acetyltransferase